jgi:hypothetical protein
MTDLLTQAFNEASKLSSEQQDALATWILEEIASEHQWDRAFAASQDKLALLAEEALEEHRAGRTQRLNPDSL